MNSFFGVVDAAIPIELLRRFSMEFESIDRGLGSFQKPISADQLLAVCHRAFGPTVKVLSAVELNGGSYNSVYRVDIGNHRPVILRVAPEPSRQGIIHRELMRNEHASLPFFASVSAMMPRVVFADFTHELIERDYMWQSMLDGIPAHQGLNAFPRPEWRGFFEQLGTIAKTIHGTLGKRFGRIVGPHYDTWSEAVISLLKDTVTDLESAGSETDDIRRVIAIASENRTVLNEITKPHLLHGDLWVQNFMLAPDADEPKIIGILDHDRSSWGDPMADWVIFMAERKPGTERDAFWNTYGALPNSHNATWRRLIYRASHLSELRLELTRQGRKEDISENRRAISEILNLLA